MSSDPAAQPSEPKDGPGTSGGTFSDEDQVNSQRAAYEAELSRVSSADMMLQAAVSLLGIGARRLGPIDDTAHPAGDGPAAGADESREGGTATAGAAPQAGKRDLEQVRDAIDGVRALLGILERRVPHALRPLRDALAQLQLAYAREVKAGSQEAQHGASETAKSPPDSPSAGTSGGTVGGEAGQTEPAARKSAPEGADQRRRPGPAESSGRLWVPGR